MAVLQARRCPSLLCSEAIEARAFRLEASQIATFAWRRENAVRRFGSFSTSSYVEENRKNNERYFLCLDKS